MIDVIAAHNKISCYNTLTGFKWISELIREKEPKENYVIGGEESFGLMIGNYVRDKDAVSAVAIICEMAAVEREAGHTVFDKLIDLYMQYGFYYEELISLTKKGKDGVKEISEMMTTFRNNPPKSIAGEVVTDILDYELLTSTNIKTGKVTALDFPKSNVLQFITDKKTKVSARPSGTEPKIKFYFSVNEPLNKKEDFDAVQKKLKDKIASIIETMNLK
jgi:phosphoglucomutase